MQLRLFSCALAATSSGKIRKNSSSSSIISAFWSLANTTSIINRIVIYKIRGSYETKVGMSLRIKLRAPLNKTQTLFELTCEIAANLDL